MSSWCRWFGVWGFSVVSFWMELFSSLHHSFRNYASTFFLKSRSHAYNVIETQSIHYTTRECGFLTQKPTAHDTCEVNFVVLSITMYNRWCLLWHILHKYGKLTLGNDTCNTLNQSSLLAIFTERKRFVRIASLLSDWTFVELVLTTPQAFVFAKMLLDLEFL